MPTTRPRALLSIVHEDHACMHPAGTEGVISRAPFQRSHGAPWCSTYPRLTQRGRSRLAERHCIKRSILQACRGPAGGDPRGPAQLGDQPRQCQLDSLPCNEPVCGLERETRELGRLLHPIAPLPWRRAGRGAAPHAVARALLRHARMPGHPVGARPRRVRRRECHTAS